MKNISIPGWIEIAKRTDNPLHTMILFFGLNKDCAKRDNPFIWLKIAETVWPIIDIGAVKYSTPETALLALKMTCKQLYSKTIFIPYKRYQNGNLANFSISLLDSEGKKIKYGGVEFKRNMFESPSIELAMNLELKLARELDKQDEIIEMLSKIHVDNKQEIALFYWNCLKDLTDYKKWIKRVRCTNDCLMLVDKKFSTVVWRKCKSFEEFTRRINFNRVPRYGDYFLLD